MKPQDLPRIAETSTETADKALFESVMSRHQGVTSQFSAGIEYRVQAGETVVGIWDSSKRSGTMFVDSLDEAKEKLVAFRNWRGKEDPDYEKYGAWVSMGFDLMVGKHKLQIFAGDEGRSTIGVLDGKVFIIDKGRDSRSANKRVAEALQNEAMRLDAVQEAVVQEAIKGWKHAGSDLIKPVTDKSEGDAIPAALEEAAVPKITVEQGAVKADGKFVDMKFERVGSKMFLMIGDPKNDRERMAVPADQSSYPDNVEWLKANWTKANDLLGALGESKDQGDDAMLYEFTGGGVVVGKDGAVKKDGKPVALKFEKLKGKLWLMVGDVDQDRLEVPDAQSGDMAAAVDWLVMSWKTVMKILATNNMQEGA